MIKQTPNNVSAGPAVSFPQSLLAPCVREVGHCRRASVLPWGPLDKQGWEGGKCVERMIRELGGECGDSELCGRLTVVVVEAVSVATTVKDKTGELEKSGRTGGRDSQQSGVPTLPLTSTDAFICPHLPSLLPSTYPFSIPVPFPLPGDELPPREHCQGHDRGVSTVSRDRVIFRKHCKQHAQQQQDQARAQVG